ncbi:MAG: winged helix-turn-helix transcriptional regulator [Rhodospirillales bacterium]|jgi:DNA-binding MarR family transcriptional regulator|nr:winged helix-turn-helix transcriptional regulator [Rhodospirillales bacterium]
MSSRPTHPPPADLPAGADAAAGQRADQAAPDYAALAAFRHALRRFTAFSEARAHAAGLTPRQHQALLAIKGAQLPHPLSVGALAEQLLIRPHSAVELIDRLVHLGLVERSEAPEDHRRAQLMLTDRAEGILYALSAAHARELQAIRPTLIELLRRFGTAPDDRGGKPET